MADSDEFDQRTKLRSPAGGPARPAPPGAPPPVAPPVAPAPFAPPPPRTPTYPVDARGAKPPPAPAPMAGFATLDQLFSAGGSTNPLLDAAIPLLLLALRLRTTSEVTDPGQLQARIAEQIRVFEARGREAGVQSEDVGPARYAICTLLDECVLNTPWGAHSGWADKPLLILFHGEAFGGETFFKLVVRASKEPARYLQLMELFYACLTVGLEGMYRFRAQGPAELTQIQRDLYERIREQRGKAPPELSIRWQGVVDQRPRLIRYVPLWVIAVIGLCVLLLAYIGFFTALGSASRPVNAALDEIGVQGMYSGQPAAGPTLKQLLGAEEAAQTLSIEESGNETRVRLLIPNLFTSGSETINPAAVPVLRAVATAANQVPGRLIVVGHTDDQPVRSLRFGDNVQLSRARAQSVADLLRSMLAHGEGIQVQGRGDTQPLATPVDSPQNRARNRRIEIVHQAGV
jgi:type VI secretion system protein ImpK